MTTQVDKFIAELDGGMLEEQLSHVISDVAGAVVEQNRKGQISLTFNVKAVSIGTFRA